MSDCHAITFVVILHDQPKKMALQASERILEDIKQHIWHVREDSACVVSFEEIGDDRTRAGS